MNGQRSSGYRERVWSVVRQVPRGRVATYGQVAYYLENVTARMVGYAMAALPPGSDVPWQRIVNGRGRCSPRRRGEGHRQQRALLEAEGVVFDARGRIDLARFGWDP